MTCLKSFMWRFWSPIECVKKTVLVNCKSKDIECRLVESTNLNNILPQPWISGYSLINFLLLLLFVAGVCVFPIIPRNSPTSSKLWIYQLCDNNNWEEVWDPVQPIRSHRILLRDRKRYYSNFCELSRQSTAHPCLDWYW